MTANRTFTARFPLTARVGSLFLLSFTTHLFVLLRDVRQSAISHFVTRRCFLGVLLIHEVAGSLQADDLHQHDVLPVLQLRCSVCHGSRTREAGLDVRSKASLLAGGESGPAIVPGDPSNSLILQRIHDGDMPPRRKLVEAAVKPMTKHEAEKLARWIAAGAPEQVIEPDSPSTAPDPLVTDEDRRFWSFQSPLQPNIPQVEDGHQVRTPIDNFILRRLERANLSLSPAADRVTLMRRAHFDLLGLPPSPQDVEQFLLDESPDAYERWIERLLSSPRYGERWGQYWLDLAGYSDSEGVVHADPTRKHAYRYRDYVIRSFNADKPYDRFLLEQLAGDELLNYEAAPVITQEIYDNLVATGFLRLAPDGTFSSLTGYVPDRLELIDDAIEVFSSAILGLTIRCARCHSHKFDPIPQRDYYRLAAVFKGALDENDWLKPDRQKESAPGKRDRLLPYVAEQERKAWEESGSKPDDQPLIRALWDRGEPSPTYILKRGNHLTPTKLVGPGAPSVLTNGRAALDIQPPWPGAKKTGRRLALAKWLIRPDHPLTARVMVNRLWRHHFGRGIVQTLDNFGTKGALPTHPQLLDWLALRLIDEGWSIKSMHRLIMTSAVYRQSSQVTPTLERIDPENRLIGRMSLRRMEGEVLRDTLLHAAGKLDLAAFGPADAVEVRDDGLVTAVADGKRNRHWRRSIYMLKRRTTPVTMLRSFDVLRLDPNCVERTESIVAPQALHLMNNEMVYELAGNLATRVLQQAGEDPADQIRWAFGLALGRPPDAEEFESAARALKRLRAHWAREKLGTRQTLVAKKHLWIREIEPDRVGENDLVSVWSSSSPDKGRRMGLIEFDIRPLKGLALTRARLQLGARNATPIRQTAAIIPPGIDGCSWNSFHKEKVSQMYMLKGLGQYDSTDNTSSDGAYVTCRGATRSELERLMIEAEQNGRLALVLIAHEDGTTYHCDWDDGTNGNPPMLVVNDIRRDAAKEAQRALRTVCHTLLNSAAFLYID